MTDPDPLPRLGVLVAVVVVFAASAVGGYTTYASYADEETASATFQAAADFGATNAGNVGSASAGNAGATTGLASAGNTDSPEQSSEADGGTSADDEDGQRSGLTAAGNSQGRTPTSEAEDTVEPESDPSGSPGSAGNAPANDTEAAVTTSVVATPVAGTAIEADPLDR